MASWLQRAMTRRLDDMEGVFGGNEPAEDRLAAKEAIIPLRCFHASRVGSYVDVQFIRAASGWRIRLCYKREHAGLPRDALIQLFHL